MKSLLLLCAVLPLALAVGTPDSRIVNGANVNIANYPWQGSYRTAGGSHTCGCVFVGDPNYALTAGHCGGSSAYSMEFGSSNRGSGSVFGISSVTRHPNYDQGPGFFPNDISVVFSSGTISGSNISPATVPTTGNPGGNGWITGWGRTCGSCGLPIALQGRQMPIISDSECSLRWGGNFQASSMVCVFDGQGGACNGDSGGPLSQDSTVYGLASWVASGCQSSAPSTYCRVGAFHDWLCSQTSNGANGCYMAGSFVVMIQ